jgi:lipoprotein signal peptidase
MTCDDRPREATSQFQWTALVLLLVVAADQATKWWAWREAGRVFVNFGGDLLVGPTVDGWYAAPVTGAVLDLLGAGVLAIAVLTQMRRRNPVVLRASAALAIGGWVSNLLDRLGMHRLTAPGSVRGAIDFVPIGEYWFNIADFFIVGATLVFLLVHGHRWATAQQTRTSADRDRPRSWSTTARIATATGIAALIAAVTLGAIHHGGTTVPLHVYQDDRTPQTVEQPWETAVPKR